MALSDELSDEVAKIFRSAWETRDGREIPEPKNLALGNDAVELKLATILYADLASSTAMVESKSWQFAAEIYKTYLYCASRLIRSEGGTITSYDGDRVMGIFIGESQTSNAARCGLKINYAVKNIINPAIKKQYSQQTYEVSQVVGIDVSEIRAARTGVRGDNDIVWVGRAANYAAKLTSAGTNYSTWITKGAFDRLSDDTKYGGNPKQLMWDSRSWTPMNNVIIYGSTWWWKI
jgi:class 3 adenylate cyclase